MSSVFLVPFHVTPTEDSIMPDGSLGAYVRCYINAESVEYAIEQSIAQLKNDGLLADKVLEPIQQMDSSQWRVHVSDQWPDHASSLMSQREFDAAIEANNVIYGPFGGYNSLPDKLRELVNPEKVNELAFADQAALVRKLGVAMKF